MFAEAFTYQLDLNLKDTTCLKVPVDIMNGTQQMPKQNYGNLQNFQDAGTDQLYVHLVQALDKLIPFYQYYFTFYKSNKRLMVLNLMQRLRIYDH